jgi:hypothetical protein
VHVCRHELAMKKSFSRNTCTCIMMHAIPAHTDIPHIDTILAHTCDICTY